MDLATCVLIIIAYSIVTAALRIAAVNERDWSILGLDYLVTLLIIIFMCIHAGSLSSKIFYLNNILRELNAGEFVPDPNTTFRIYGEGVRIDETMAPATTSGTSEATVTRSTP